MKRNTLILVTILLVLISSGCVKENKALDVEDDLLSISVSILPEAYFVDRIAGEKASVNVMVGPGDDPHAYEPTPEQMRQLEKADLYFSIGVEFESVWLPRFQNTNKNLLIIDAAEGVERIPMAAATSSEDHEDHGEFDPHIWLSPSRVRMIVQNITESLIEIDPKNSDFYQTNLAVMLSDIDLLDEYIHKKLDGITNRYFITYHPAWGYFASEYGLEMIAIEIGGQEPGAESMAETLDLMKQYQLDEIFIQKEFSAKSAQAIADISGASVVVLDPLAYEWVTNMRLMADDFATTLNN